MATVVKKQLVIPDLVAVAFGVTMWQWSPLGDADAGDDLIIPYRADKTFHIFGTFAGATLVVEGSNELTAPGNYVTCQKAESGAMSFTTSPQGETVLQNFYRIRPRTSGGGGASVTVIVVVRGSL